MGYERDDRRWSNADRGGRGGEWRGGYDRDRGGPPSGYDRSERGFFDRAGDEVRSWFGDEEAERRRRYDERYDDRYEGRGDGDRGGYDRGAYTRSQGYGGQGYGGRPQGQQGGYGGRSSGSGDRDENYFGGRGQDRSRVSGYGWSGAGEYGADRSRDDDRYATQAGGTASDHSYRSWRDRQMQELDRDYDDYRRENQSRFETEFSSYRTRRQGQRDMAGKVREHMEVVGSDGQHVGTVDHVRGDQIQLTKNDEAAGGRHHVIPSSWIETVDDKVTLAKTAHEAKRAWRDDPQEQKRGGLFGGGDDDRDGGSRTLGRSFSGTY